MSDVKNASMDDFIELIRSQAEKFQCLILICNDGTCTSYVAEGGNRREHQGYLNDMIAMARRDVMNSLTGSAFDDLMGDIQPLELRSVTIKGEP